MKVKDLRPAEYNPRKISDAQAKALKQALEVFGDLGGIVFNRKTGNLVGGHQRIKALDPEWAITLDANDGDALDKCGTVGRGFIETPFGRLDFRLVDWDLNVEKAANVAANRHGGEWDDLKLKELLVGLDDGSGLVDLTGFAPVDLEGLLGRGGEQAPTPSEQEKLFEQLTITLTKAQLATVGFAIDQAVKAGDFGDTGNENRRGNAIARICEEYRR